MESGAFSQSWAMIRNLALQRVVREDPVHQPHGERFVGVVAPAEEHDLPRARVADGLEQAPVPFDVVGEAELRRGDAELRRPPQ